LKTRDNKKYEKLLEYKKNNDPRWDFYKFYMDSKGVAMRRIPPIYRRMSQLIAFRKDLYDRLWAAKGKGALKEWAKDKFVMNEAELERGQFIGEDDGQAKAYVPLHYISRIGSKEGELEISNVSLDLPNSLKAFYEMSTNYENMTRILPQLELTKDVLRERKVTQRTGGIPLLGWNKQTKTEKGGALYKRFEDYMNMEVYGRKRKIGSIIKVRKHKIDTTKIWDFVKSIVGLRGLGLNFYSGIQNPIVGLAQNMMEAGALQYMSPKDLWEGIFTYWKEIPGLTSDIINRKPTSKLGVIITQMDILQHKSGYGQPMKKGSILSAKGIGKRLLSGNLYMFMMEGGEHWVQTTLFIAMAKGKRILTEKGSMSFWDSLSVKNGLISVDPAFRDKMNMHAPKGSLAKKEFLGFMRQFYGISQRAHGHYAQRDGPAMRQYWMAQHGEQFRRWMPPGTKRRWANISDIVKSPGRRRGAIFNERLQSKSEGMYTSTFTYMFDMLKDLRAMKYATLQEDWNNLKQKRGKRPLFFWNDPSIPQYQKENMRRHITEALTLAIVWISINLIEEDDDKDSWAFNMGLYHLYRLQSELAFFWNIQEAGKLISSPAASISLIEAAFKFMFQLSMNPTEEYKRDYGLYKKGDLKLMARLHKLTPLYYQVIRVAVPDKEVNWFRRVSN